MVGYGTLTPRVMVRSHPPQPFAIMEIDLSLDNCYVYDS